MSRHVSYWLVPAAPERAVLQSLIDTLARRYQAPPFVPHMTLYSGFSPADERPLELMTLATHAVHAVRLQAERILYTAAFTKTLFLQMAPCPLAQQLTEALRRCAATPSAYTLDPHVSLLYASLPESEQRHLADTLPLPLAGIVCDEIWAMASEGPTRTAADVRAWTVLGSQPLLPAP